MIRAAVVGATGYTGAELLQYLLRHPRARVTHCTSESSAGKRLSEVHPWLTGRDLGKMRLENLDAAAVAGDSDVAFLCLPHGQSARTGQALLERKVKVIDLSADFRLKSAAVYEEWYGEHPCPDLLRRAVYGLPEIHRKKIAKADLVANPGCYATGTALTLLPLVKSGLAKKGSIVVDAKSGTSGAGKKIEARYLYCEVNENFLAYGVARHRHVPEIEQTLSEAAGSDITLTFVPHLLPVNRGILVTAYADLKKRVSTADLLKVYSRFYSGEPFVKVLDEGRFPELQPVQRTNFCHIGLRVDERHGRAVVLGVIDNLGKGASSQAVQNMNLLFRLEETTGLL